VEGWQAKPDGVVIGESHRVWLARLQVAPIEEYSGDTIPINYPRIAIMRYVIKPFNDKSCRGLYE
jgi:hypothetical protein